jgi:hypothetical protein
MLLAGQGTEKKENDVRNVSVTQLHVLAQLEVDEV